MIYILFGVSRPTSPRRHHPRQEKGAAGCERAANAAAAGHIRARAYGAQQEDHYPEGHLKGPGAGHHHNERLAQ